MTSKHDVATKIISDQKTDVENTRLKQFQIFVRLTTSKILGCENVTSMLSNVATKRQSKASAVTTSCDSWERALSLPEYG